MNQPRRGLVSAADAMRSWSFRSGMESDRMLILNQVWERVVGGYARHWALAGVKRGVIYVRTRSPAAAQELQLKTGELVKGLNKYFKRAWIKGIKPARANGV